MKTPYEIFSEETQPIEGSDLRSKNGIYFPYCCWMADRKAEFLKAFPETVLLDDNILNSHDLEKLFNWIVTVWYDTTRV